MYAIRHKTSKIHKNLCVGIITIPHSKKTKFGQSHIMKPYVDWFEEQGVRVIPIPYDTPVENIDGYFHSIHGLLIPGGETPYILKQKSFLNTVTRFFELSLGEYFPIWGTCFGFELLIYLVAGHIRFKPFIAHGLYPIRLTPEGHRSKLFGSFPASYIHRLENTDSTAENHEFGISPRDFLANDNLRRFYSVLATSQDESGKEYVAVIESKYYPIYGVQWHPERQPKDGTPFADFFIGELRKSKHRNRAGNGVRYLSSIMKPHKCRQYDEHKELMCYFF
jgi:gamma-glutamyl hydrolase